MKLAELFESVIDASDRFIDKKAYDDDEKDIEVKGQHIDAHDAMYKAQYKRARENPQPMKIVGHEKQILDFAKKNVEFVVAQEVKHHGANADVDEVFYHIFMDEKIQQLFDDIHEYDGTNKHSDEVMHKLGHIIQTEFDRQTKTRSVR